MEPLPALVRRAPWAEPLLVLGCFGALTVIMTWPTVLLLDQGINAFGDVVLQLTTMTWDAHALATGPLHIFDAPFFYPYYHSLAYSDHLIGQTLLTWPIFALTGNPALALNAYKLGSFVATGLGTYLLVRDTTGSRAAGLVAGVAFAFTGLRFMQLTHLHILATEGFPLTLWALRRGLARNSGGWLALAAAFFALMALCSVYHSYFLALLVGGYLLWWAGLWWRARGLRGPVRLWGSRPARLALTGGVLGLLLLPVYVPYLQVNSELGLARSIYEVQNWSAVWQYYLRVLPSNWFWGHLRPAMTSIAGERELFPGLLLLVLAALGIVLGGRLSIQRAPAGAAPEAMPAPAWQPSRGAERWFWVGAGLAALVLTFGLSARLPNGWEIPLPYALLYDWVPGFQALRVPVRFAMLVHLALAVLAGYGTAELGWRIADWRGRKHAAQAAAPRNVADSRSSIRNPGYPPGAAIRMGLVAVLVLGILGESAQELDLSNHRDVRPAQIEPYSWLATQPPGPVIEFPFRGDSGDIWDAYWGTYHWQPLVNGWSGFVPPGTVYLSRALAAFPDPATVALLQGLEVRHVVVHLWQYPKDQQAALRTRLDATPGLTPAHQAGEDYVYALAPDPWLRRLGEGGEPQVWFSGGLGQEHPEMEVPAYFARNRLGWGERVHGDVPLGYKPLPPLPWGTPADVIVQPPGAAPPAGYAAAGGNAFATVYGRDAALLQRYDLPAGAPASGPLSFAPAAGAVRYTFGALVTTTVTLPACGTAPAATLAVPPGVSTYTTRQVCSPFNPADVGRVPPEGARLLAAEGWAALPPGTPEGVQPQPATLLAETATGATATATGEITSEVRLVPRAPQDGQYTLTLDVYQKPWGTHPDGHYGTFSLPVPVGAGGRTYALTLHPAEKMVTAQLNGQPAEVFAWQGPPDEGDFAASLVLTLGDRLITHVPLYEFTLRAGRLTAVDPHPGQTVVAPLAGP